MLSILIPSFNHDVTTLLKLLIEEKSRCMSPIEIIVGNDGSTIDIGQQHDWANEVLFLSTNKIGRTANRYNLAMQASYDRLLFLDADVLPIKKNFIQNYLEQYQNPIIFGGYTYTTLCPNEDVSLRWWYGKNREEQSADRRQNNPYAYTFSGNMLIDKNLFISLYPTIDFPCYGMDVVMAAILESNKTSIVHIENPILHTGLEDNKVFLKKSLEAVHTRYQYLELKDIKSNSNRLIKTYQILKKWRLHTIGKFIFNNFGKWFVNHLTSSRPNLLIFDFYRLCYRCTLS